MHKRQSTVNGQVSQSGECNEWDNAIARAEAEVREAERRIAELRLSILSFRRMRNRGLPLETTDSRAQD